MTTPHHASGSEAARHDLYAHIHKGLRACMSHLLVRLGRLDADDAAEVDELRGEIAALLAIARSHVEHEERFIHPVLRERAPGSSDLVAGEHGQHLEAIAALEARLPTLAGRPEAVAALYREFGAFVAENLEHMQHEETAHNAALWASCSDAELLAIEQRIVASLTPAEHAFTARWMLPHMNPAERAGLLAAMRSAAPPQAFDGLMSVLRPLLAGRDWAKLTAALGIPARPWPAVA